MKTTQSATLHDLWIPPEEDEIKFRLKFRFTKKNHGFERQQRLQTIVSIVYSTEMFVLIYLS
jgi:hypothetical protein